jgi:hypothetical protein
MDNGRGNTDPFEDLGLGGPHTCLFLRIGVIMSEQVQHTVYG